MKQVKSAFCLENADLIFLLKHRFYRGDFMLKFADAHCDTITKLRPQQLALGCDTTLAHLDLPRLQEGTQLQFMAFFLQQASPTEAWPLLRKHWRSLQQAVVLNGGVEILTDLRQAGCFQQTERPQLLLAVEGLDLLAENGEAGAEELFQLGFRSLGLFWNNDNWLGCGAAAQGVADTGLTLAGQDFVRYAEERGFLLDWAHASAGSFWHGAAICHKPLFVSHACCAELCLHRRNLTDEQLRALGESGGWLGVALAPAFLRPDGRAELADVVRHIQHAVKLAGEEAVGLGSDFDGLDELPLGLEGVQSWPCLAEALVAAGLPEALVAKIMGKNLLRFLREY